MDAGSKVMIALFSFCSAFLTALFTGWIGYLKVQLELQQREKEFERTLAHQEAALNAREKEMEFALSQFQEEIRQREKELELTLAHQGAALSAREKEMELALSQFQEEHKLHFSVETVLLELLKDDQWRLRSFQAIQRHIGGFGDDELRQILVRSGAIKFTNTNGDELWGLLERNRDRLGAIVLDIETETRPLPNELSKEE